MPTIRKTRVEFEGRIEEREVIVPPPPGGSCGTYVKVAERAAWDFALVSVAAQVSLVDGVVQGVRIALGGVAPIPWRATDAERALVGHRLTAQTLDEAALAATAGARPLAHNAYKVDLLQGVVRQALGKLAAEQGCSASHSVRSITHLR
jgi:xanthine dehydrogenase YagS FAD-binding subunit